MRLIELLFNLIDFLTAISNIIAREKKLIHLSKCKMHKRDLYFFHCNFYSATKVLVLLSRISRPLFTVPITAGTYVCYCTWKRISSRIDVRVYFPITDRIIANLHPSECARIRRFSRYLRREENGWLPGTVGRFCIVKEPWLCQRRHGTSKIIKWHCSRNGVDVRRRPESFERAVSKKLASGQSPLRSLDTTLPSKL